MTEDEVRCRAGASGLELIGRAHELGVLTGLLDTLASEAASVVIHGEVGQGKSSLLRWMAGAASERGMTVVEVTGIEFERGLGFSGLTAVLRPLLHHTDELGDAQRAALKVALGFSEGDAPVLTAYAATLELLSLASDKAPLLVLADDAQWVDPASLEALVFAAHRCGADRVGFAFAQRTGTACLLDRTGFERIELSGLGREEAVALLGLRDGVAAAVAERCWELTEGNPLALIEGTRGLSPGQRSGAEPLPPALPVVDRLLETYRVELRELPEPTLHALGVAALESSNDLAVIAPALAALGGSLTDLRPAEQRAVVLLAGGRVTWRHPLIRSAVYQILGGEQRRASHHALAEAASAAGRDEQALWHLSETVLGPDDGLAHRLADLGDAARRRGALSAAAEAYEHAARLSTATDWADEQLLAAASARWGAGDAQLSASLLRSAIDRIGDSAPATRARMAILLGQAEMWEIGPLAGVARFERHASEVWEDRPDIAAFLLLHASSARLFALDAEGAVEAAGRAVTAAERSEDVPAAFASTAIRTLARLFAGQEPAAEQQLDAIGKLAVAALTERVEGADDLVQLCAYGLIVCERWSAAMGLLRQVIESGAAAGMIERTAFARLLLAEALWRTGRWAESVGELTQARSLQEAAKPGLVLPGIAALLARNDAGFGREGSCRAHVHEVLGGPAAPATEQIEQFLVVASSALGLLELGAGRFTAAATAFDQVTARAGHITEPGWLWWQADAVEAYVGCGRIVDAEQALARLEEQASASNRGWALAAADRAHGLLGGSRVPRVAGGPHDKSCDAYLTAALEGFRMVGAPFEEARTLLARGRQRQRDGARADAGRDLAAARTIFDRLGARGWSEQASAVRGEVSGADDSLTSRLTPAELRVAIAVGRGASNREAAEELFVSIKTVDYHLQSIYRKLGLRSRTQLAALVLGEPGNLPV